MVSDPWLRKAREQTLRALADRLTKTVGIKIEYRWLRYDEHLRHWVWPENGSMVQWDGYNVWPCVRLWLYDQRRMIWYASEVEESRAPYHQVGKPVQGVQSEASDDWGAI